MPFKFNYIQFIMPTFSMPYLDRSLKLIDLLLGPDEDIHAFFCEEIGRIELLTKFSRDELLLMMDPESELRKEVINHYNQMAAARAASVID
jgi:hypothetical protein